MSQNEASEDENSILPFLINSLTDDRGQTQFCQNLIAIYLKKELVHAQQNFQKQKS